MKLSVRRVEVLNGYCAEVLPKPDQIAVFEDY